MSDGLREQRFGVRNPPLVSENESDSEIEIDGDDTANDAIPFFGVAVTFGEKYNFGYDVLYTFKISK